MQLGRIVLTDGHQGPPGILAEAIRALSDPCLLRWREVWRFPLVEAECMSKRAKHRSDALRRGGETFARHGAGRGGCRFGDQQLALAVADLPRLATFRPPQPVH